MISLDDFEILHPIGVGNTGKVYLAKTKSNGSLVAIKTVRKDYVIENDEVERKKHERKVLTSIREKACPFIITTYASFQAEARLFHVMEYASGGDLMFHIQKGPFGIERAKFYAAEALIGLKFLHDLGIIYRALQLDNIVLMPDGHIKLIGFSVAKDGMGDGKTTKTFCGSADFMAPEILRDKLYGLAVDWWAFGVLLYQMLLQKAPFKGEDEDEIYDAILENDPSFPSETPKDAVDILRRLLKREPTERLGYQGPAEVMHHAFFEDIDWDAVEQCKLLPPFVPSVDGPNDLGNFDTSVTSGEPILTPLENKLTPAMQEEFRGFSWGGIE